LPSQCRVNERRKTVITSGHPLGFDIGFRRNSPSRTCKSCFGGMMNTWFGWRCNLSVISSHIRVVRKNLVQQGGRGSHVINDYDTDAQINRQML
jgi:hypothetical protein